VFRGGCCEEVSVLDGIGGIGWNFEMAEVLEAMGFPSDWCEQALRSSGGVEPAVELLLQWQADGGAPPGESSSPSPPAVSTVTNPMSPVAPGLDAVVPDAGIAAEGRRRSNPELRLKQVLRIHPLLTEFK